MVPLRCDLLSLLDRMNLKSDFCVLIPDLSISYILRVIQYFHKIYKFYFKMWYLVRGNKISLDPLLWKIKSMPEKNRNDWMKNNHTWISLVYLDLNGNILRRIYKRHILRKFAWHLKKTRFSKSLCISEYFIFHLLRKSFVK